MTDHSTQQVQVTPRTDGSRLLIDVVDDLRWSNGNPVTRDWLTAMLTDIESEAARSVPVAEGLREALERLTAVVDESAPGEFRWKVRNEVSAAQAALAYTLPDPAEVPARPICEDCGGSGAGQLGQPCSICNGSGLLATAGEYDWDKMRRDGIAVPFATPPDPAEDELHLAGPSAWADLDDGTDPQGKAAAEKYVESIGPAEGQEPTVIDVNEERGAHPLSRRITQSEGRGARRKGAGEPGEWP